MKDILLTAEDYRQIASLGISETQIRTQIDIFKDSSFYQKLNRPCRVDDGICRITPPEMDRYLHLHQEAAARGRFLKFVPASGAASRMFQALHHIYEAHGDDLGVIVQKSHRGDAACREGLQLLENIQNFPFYSDLKEIMAQDGLSLDSLMQQGKVKAIWEYLLTDRGLGYGSLPKGLLKFHSYDAGCRTAFEEHLCEAAYYVKDQNNICRLHFTISPEQETRFRQLFHEVRPGYESRCHAVFQVSFSHQKSSTNTIAVDLENAPFRDKNGGLLFRPGGHGALLENLRELGGDLVYIKNIDNIVPDHLKAPTFFWKKILGGYLVETQQLVQTALSRLEADNSPEGLGQVEEFVRDRLFLNFPGTYPQWPLEGKRNFLFKKLNRPIRVCGMVPNTGEPGGGPFWVEGADKTLSLQIVEKAQVDLADPQQKAIWKSSTYFNPVDLVCALRDVQGRPFALSKYVDPRAVFISKKSKDGRQLKALEFPGLWNGSMSDWITIFLEIPGETFNPVKTVLDLLRPEHQPQCDSLFSH